MTHHGDEHVGENDNDGHVVECEEEQPDTLDHRRGVAAARESRRVVAVYALGRPFDLDVLYWNQAEHRPEQAVSTPFAGHLISTFSTGTRPNITQNRLYPRPWPAI